MTCLWCWYPEITIEVDVVSTRINELQLKAAEHSREHDMDLSHCQTRNLSTNETELGVLVDKYLLLSQTPSCPTRERD